MIKQLIQTETKVLSSNTVIDCGNGDVAIGMADVKDTPNVLITFSNIPQQEVGSSVKNKDVINTPVVVSFDSVESIKVLNKTVQAAMNKLKKKEEVAKRAALPHFVVKTGSIMIPSSFKCTNPNAEKIMSCQQYFNENGKLDEAIDVTSTLTLTDGYVRYLVAKYNKLEKVEVVAANGIDIKVGNQVIKFTSDNIRLSYGLGKDDETGEKKFYLSIINGGKRYEIPAEDNVEAATMVKKITNVFDAKIGIAAVSTMNFGLKERLEEAGITVAYA